MLFSIPENATKDFFWKCYSTLSVYYPISRTLENEATDYPGLKFPEFEFKKRDPIIPLIYEDYYVDTNDQERYKLKQRFYWKSYSTLSVYF